MSTFGSGYLNGGNGSQYTSKSDLANFYPITWKREVKRERDFNFIMKNYVTMYNHMGGQGAVYNIPTIGRLAVNDKTAGAPVLLQTFNPGNYTITLDKHRETSFALDDVATYQSMYNTRQLMVQEAGYALARDTDNFILAHRAAINYYASQRIFYTTTGVQNTGDAKKLDGAVILAAKEILDLARVPEQGRALIVGIEQYNDLLTNDAFINFDFRDRGIAAPTSTGVVGSIYGIPVIKNNSITVNSATGYVNGTGATPGPTPGVASSIYLPTQGSYTALPTSLGTGAGISNTVQSAILVHSDWMHFLNQWMPRMETSREALYLVDAVIMHQYYGGKVYREDHAVVIHTAV